MNVDPEPISFPARIFRKTGRFYPILILLIIQLISTPLLVILSIVPTQENAHFNSYQLENLIFVEIIGLFIRNLLMLILFYLFNRSVFQRLAILAEKKNEEIHLDLEQKAWKQATTASRNTIFFEFFGLIILVLIPIMCYGSMWMYLRPDQTLYLGFSIVAAGIAILLLESMSIDQFFEPILSALLPRRFEDQISGIKGIPIWLKLTNSLIGLVVICLLLIIPVSFHQANVIYLDSTKSYDLLLETLQILIKAGIGGIVIGGFLSILIVSAFTRPFIKMIGLFKKIEKGDLSQRIGVSMPDEFGKLNIYINDTINHLQILNSTLEQKVADRTAELQQINALLEIELTERRIAEEQLSYSALHDPLTNLPNRALFSDRLNHTLERSRRHKNYSYAVFFMDLDRFKVVNDSLGHDTGDLLLVETAMRISSCIRREDTVARLGGDEFVILLEESDDPGYFSKVAERILHEMASPAILDNHKVFVSVSLGIVLGSEAYNKAEDILRDADIAMYQAKKHGRGRYEIFNPSMLDHVISRLQLEVEMRSALENRQFIVYYQPIIQLVENKIIGFEALLRWNHPTKGLLLPADFISIAEETGLIVPIGYWVIQEACRQLQDWITQNPHQSNLSVNVNLSPKQFSDSGLIEKVTAIIDANHLQPSQLKLEITESLIIENRESVSTTLLKLRQIGVQVEIDDFGTGYSSLGYLNMLPVDTLKIDRSFIHQIKENNGGIEIVQTILALARNLGMNVIAEGVETNTQLESLKTLGCDFVQGFFFYEALMPQEAVKLIQEHSNGL